MSIHENHHSHILGLKGALRYVRAYRGQTFVIKLGGEVLGDGAILDQVAGQLALLASLGIHPVVVHGGGPQVTALGRRLGIEPNQIAGRRVTDDATLELVKMVCAGTINTDLVAALGRHQVDAVGLTGLDAGLIRAHRRPPVALVDDAGEHRTVDFGRVGEIEKVEPRLLTTLLESGFVPVIACLAGGNGEAFNVNADTVAEAVAAALKAQKLIFLTGAPGVLRDRADPATLVPFADPDDLAALLKSGAIAGGMRPKVEACLRAAGRGVARTHIIDGRAPDALLLEVFTGAGCGTMIVGEKEKAEYLDGELSDGQLSA